MGNYDARVYTGGPQGGISACVTNLAGGFVLGEERVEGGIWYRLVYNAANSAINPGQVASPIPLGGGPYSVTVSTALNNNNHIGGVVCHNTTVPTGTYFWGAYRGYLASGTVQTGITANTGLAMYISSNGSFLPLSVTVAGMATSGNVVCAGSVIGPTAGTVAVRQASVWINMS